LNSAYLTSENEGSLIEVVGLYHGTVLYDNTYVLSSTAPTCCAFDYAGIDTVWFQSRFQAPDFSFNNAFEMDNLVVNESLAIPEAGTGPVGALLLLSLGVGAFRKLRNKGVAGQH